MKKILTIIFLCFCFFVTTAQSALQTYFLEEELRIQKADSIEQKIVEFIDLNFSTYNLTQSLINEITQDMNHLHHDVQLLIEGTELQSLLDNVKRRELRKLYLIENPTASNYFVPKELPFELMQQCVNGGFEDGIANYTFRSDFIETPVHFPLDGCTRGIPPTAFTPTGLNNFANRATLVSPGNEPLLASASILINRVLTGNRALKLNPTPTDSGTAQGEGNSTTVFRNFIVNEPQIQFSFLQLGHVVNTTSNGHFRPAFRYRIIDNLTQQVLFTRCSTMDLTDCRFQQVNQNIWGQPYVLAYTPNWICETINTADFIGQNVRLEFNVQDCGHRGHFSTVYIDNICGVSCDSTWGSINATPAEINCPTTSFEFCGTYTLPTGASMTSVSLNILTSGNAIASTLTPTMVNGTDFCFTINPSDFGSNPTGNYTLQVVVGNTSNCSLISNVTETFGMITFSDCCLPTLNSSTTISIEVNQERSDWIRSTDVITFGDGVSGNGVVYHAGNFVEFNPGFEAVFGSQFSSYIEGCTGDFEYRMNTAIDKVYVDAFEQIILPEIHLIKIQREKGIKIFPNPASDFVTISISDETIQKILLLSIDGKQTVIQNISTNDYTVDLSSYSKGIYIISIQSSSGEIYNEKIIKM